MILVIAFIFIVLLYLLAGKTRNSWMNQFVFLVLVVLILHFVLIIFQIHPAFLIFLNFSSISFLTMMFFVMVMFNKNIFPTPDSKFAMWGSFATLCAFVMVLELKSLYWPSAVFVPGDTRALKTEFVLQNIREIFLKSNLFVNLNLVIVVFICLIFCYEVVYRSGK